MDNNIISGADEMAQKIEAIKEYVTVDVLDVIGVESVKHFKHNFDNEGFDNDKWKARAKAPKLDKKILTGQGSGDHLADSLDYRTEGNTVVITTDKPYAQIHNEGFTGTENVSEHTRTVKGAAQKVKAHTRQMKMPQRQFIGDSELLNEKITEKITRDLTRLSS